MSVVAATERVQRKGLAHGSAASDVYCPRRLAVVDDDDVIAVADEGKKRVMRLNSNLTDIADGISKKDAKNLS